MNRHRAIQLLAAVVAVAAVASSAMLVRPIDADRQKLQLSGNPELGESAPPEVVLTSAALGAFRGVAINGFWYRANRLQQEGKFYEANALAQAITTLQPRFGQVWVFQAWNMAYNISVATHTPQERWDWVNRGIELLRDKGIPLNRTNIRLYDQLSWIFFHKIGRFSDDQHWYYKKQLAHEWQQLLGAPTQGATAQQVVDAFRPIAEAPDTFNQLIVEHPEVQPLVTRFAVLGYGPDIHLLRQIGGLEMFSRSGGATLVSREAIREAESYDDALLPLINDPDLRPALDLLLAYLRKGALIDQYHMEPQFMLELMEGTRLNPDDPVPVPLDWRHPATHGYYWAALGVERMLAAREKKNIDQLNTDRRAIHSLQQLMRFGRISYNPIEGYIDMVPDTRFIPAYETTFELARGRAESGEFRQGAATSYETGHENFLMAAVVNTYLYGDEAQARHYFDKARRLYGRNADGSLNARYRKPFKQVVYDELEEDLGQFYGRRQMMDALLVRSFTQGLANARPDVFERFVGMARQMHKRFQAKAIATPTAVQRRLQFVPFDQLLDESYIIFMRRADVQLMLRTRIWRYTPLVLLRRVNDRLREVFDAQCRQVGLESATAFPEPPGMDKYRKQLPQRPEPAEDQIDIESVERK
ncbi:MAG: hypothetical protein V3U29_00250 [Phycisphaeraceae bacterium]